MKKVYDERSGSVRLSFEDKLETVMERVGLYELADGQGQIDEIYIDLCKIITEVLRLSAPTIIIAGEEHRTQDVKAVFSALDIEHLEWVADQFKKINYTIHFKKAYLRTALYNSYFEFEAGLHNDLREAGAI